MLPQPLRPPGLVAASASGAAVSLWGSPEGLLGLFGVLVLADVGCGYHPPFRKLCPFQHLSFRSLHQVPVQGDPDEDRVGDVRRTVQGAPASRLSLALLVVVLEVCQLIQDELVPLIVLRAGIALIEYQGQEVFPSRGGGDSGDLPYPEVLIPSAVGLPLPLPCPHPCVRVQEEMVPAFHSHLLHCIPSVSVSIR